MIRSKLKGYLAERGIKQAWLAKELHVSESKVSEILSGKRPLYADVLAQICKILGVSSDLFLK